MLNARYGLASPATFAAPRATITPLLTPTSQATTFTDTLDSTMQVGADGTFAFQDVSGGQYQVAIGASTFAKPFGGVARDVEGPRDERRRLPGGEEKEREQMRGELTSDQAARTR